MSEEKGIVFTVFLSHRHIFNYFHLVTELIFLPCLITFTSDVNGHLTFHTHLQVLCFVFHIAVNIIDTCFHLPWNLGSIIVRLAGLFK